MITLFFIEFFFFFLFEIFFRLSALLEGLEALYQIKVIEVKYITCEFDASIELPSGIFNSILVSSKFLLILFLEEEGEEEEEEKGTGLSITLSIKQNIYIFLLDSSNKLFDIQMVGTFFI